VLEKEKDQAVRHGDRIEFEQSLDAASLKILFLSVVDQPVSYGHLTYTQKILTAIGYSVVFYGFAEMILD
jgi:hypothetical protein